MFVDIIQVDCDDEGEFVCLGRSFAGVRDSVVPAPAWPESPGFGLALGGSGLVNSQAEPKAKILAWPGSALA